MTGIFDRCLSLLDTCHIVGVAHLCKQLGNVKFVKLIITVCLAINSRRSLCSHDSFVLEKQTSDLCVDGWCHLVHRVVRVAKHTSHAIVMKVSRQTFGKCG
jgi:hypothetical protein